MLRLALLPVFFCLFAGSSAALAQGPCSMTVVTDKLVCVIPQLYGPGGLSSSGTVLKNTNHQGHFGDSFISDLTPLNSAVGSQLTQLPLASPTSGITLTFDPTTGVFAPSTEASFGPILGERAETIGRHRLFVAFSYQYFGFHSLDGVNLKSIPAVYTHQNLLLSGSNPPRTCSVDGDNLTGCGFVRDVIATTNQIGLRVNQFTTYFTFGLTSRIDVSVAIPVVNVRMGVASRAVIIPNSNSGFHIFVTRVPDCPDPCFNASFANRRTATGIGDVIVRVKGSAWRGERAGIALGLDIRTPTGDELDFLGSGAVGVKPFAVFSYRARVAPHFTLGYERNGDSILAGNLPQNMKGHLPDQFIYSGGVDIAVSRALTLAFDLLGQRVFDSRRVAITTFSDLGPCLPTGLRRGDANYCTSAGTPNKFPNLIQTTGSFSIHNASAGLKFSPIRNRRLIVTANTLFKLDDGGLRAKVVPLVGVSYTF